MELVERYLNRIRTFLPAENQSDIIQELRANLEAQIEDREGELGRGLTAPELEEILRKHGHPLLVASRYRPQRFLVGPAVFPFYWMAIKLGLIIAGVVTLIGSVASIGGGDSAGQLASSVVAFPFHYVGNALPLFAVITIGASLFELAQTRGRWWEKWNPSSLPPADSAKAVSEHLAEGFSKSLGQPKPNWTWRAWGGLFGHFLLVVWWWLIPSCPFLIFGAPFLTTTPAWAVFHAPVLHLLLVGLVFHLLPCLRPRWLWLHSLTGVAATVLTLLSVRVMMGTGDVVGLIDPAKASADLVHGVELVNRIVSTGFVVSSALLPLLILLKSFKLLRSIQTSNT